MKNLKKAFTLAEVLITLGVIGVVAAVTMPTLIQNHKKQEATARLKKFYSTMSQAILSAENETGQKAFEWSDFTTMPDNSIKHDYTYAYWNKYLAPYIKVLKVEKGVYDEENNINNKTKVYFSDGSTVELNVGFCVSLYFDTNGDKNPNELGRDRFVFFISTSFIQNLPRESEMYRNHSFNAVYLPQYNTEEKALTACKQDAGKCSAYLLYKNWEITKEYPYKI